MTDLIAREGFRIATTFEDKVAEATRLFKEGRTGASPLAAARLQEAFTTSDFPVLLGNGFERQAIAAQKAAVREFEPILTDVTVDRFGKHQLIDLWADDAFERVREGEEYKGATLNETGLTHEAQKRGRVFGLTWEMIRDRRFSELARFPFWLGNGSVKGENKAVADLLVANGSWNPAFFGTVDTKPLTYANLEAAVVAMGQKTNHRNELVSTSDLVLVYAPALAPTVARLTTALEVEVGAGTKDDPKVKISNPWRGLSTLASETVGKALGTNAGTAWALVQGKSSDLPSIIRTKLAGHETVDIRVKRDQGAAIGGGDLPIEAGSFMDDTIWYRGRDVYGIDPAFNTGVYASKGA